MTLDSLGKKREVHYIYGGNGLAAIYVKNAGKDSLFAAATDRQGSLMATMHTASGKVERYSYDPFGRRRSADNWLQDVRTEPRFSRGYCMHEHVSEMDMIDMNGRLYDPVLCQFLSPDPYIQDPTNWQNYNRYGYCMQNPMLYTDPSGEFVWAAVIIGAVVGAYMGGTLANDGQMNPTKWNYSAGQTWGYMAGGAVVGAISGAVGGCVAASGMPFANTAGIAVGSFVNSVGTTLYTEGKYSNVSISFGACSYNFLNNEFGYIGKSGNSTMENIGYGFGSMALLRDINNLFDATNSNVYTQIEDKYGRFDKISHTGIETDDGRKLMSYGPNPLHQKNEPPMNLRGFAFRLRTSSAEYEIHPELSMKSSTLVLNKKLWSFLRKISERAPYQGVSSNCVNWASLGLWLNGIPNVGLHPFLLHASVELYSTGFYDVMASQAQIHNQ